VGSVPDVKVSLFNIYKLDLKTFSKRKVNIQVLREEKTETLVN
jgi:hypothetical protein